MNLEIALDKGNICIILKNKSKIIDRTTIEEKDKLSDILLLELANIIKRNSLLKNQIKNISVKSDLPDSYTSARIAKSIAKSFVFAKKQT